jgi:type II secretory pathway component PulM
MVLITGSWRLWLAGTAVSLAIFGVLYFTVIKPDSNAANQAVKTTLQQSQQQLSTAQQQLQNATGGSGVSSQVQQKLADAQKLTACLANAGIDTAKIQACKTQFSK